MGSARMAVACITLIAVSGCAGATSESPELKWLGGGVVAGEGMSVSKPNKPYLYGGLRLCLDKSGVVTVKNVRLEQPQGGIRLDAYTLLPHDGTSNDDTIGNGESITIQHKGLPRANREVTQVCSPEGSPTQKRTELVLQLSHSGESSGFTSGFLVDYISGGHTRVLRINLSYVFCSNTKKDMPDLCTAHKEISQTSEE
jgi:hypothetical protein